MPKLDAIDHEIIAVLQQEGRISNIDLAERVGLSPTPCGRRVRRLETTGVITGYGARIDPSALGLGVSVLVTVRLAKQTAADIEQFLAAVAKQPEITECLLMAGNIDYVLRVWVRDVEALRDFVLTKLKRIPHVADTTTMLILESTKG